MLEVLLLLLVLFRFDEALGGFECSTIEVVVAEFVDEREYNRLVFVEVDETTLAEAV